MTNTFKIGEGFLDMDGPDQDQAVTIARIAHEANRAWCEFNGDMSQPAWDDAPEWQTASAINGVIFHMQNPGIADSASHDSWMAEKVAAGWVYGEEKNPDASPPTHPCITDYENLPPAQRFKDRLFSTVVNAALNRSA